ncbi:MAG TPA: argininosuccinate synthase [Planctomycetota bacterium]|jgi:argininosuccinate synthase|nr:argininosuccinate synthase [Planctomycetota bacterium]
MPKKICLAYSGGLDTSVALAWLVETYHLPVVCFVGDVGQGAAELEGIEGKARASGASEVAVVDLRRSFLADFAWPTLRAGAVYEERYLLGTSIARPCLAKAQVAAALERGADALAHGCTGKGNDQVRFERAYAALAPDLDVIAPWRVWDLRSREDLLRYAAERRIPVQASAEKIYSRDRNLWHLSHEGGALEDPGNAPPEDVWVLTRSPKEAPDEPATVEVGFEGGTPVSLDGVRLDPVALLEELNARAGEHGVGRADLVENRLVGIKSRGCYETPGGTVLVEAHRALEELVLDRETRHAKDLLAHRYAEVVYDGAWFTPLREALDAFVGKTQERVTGSVRVRLFKGTATAVERRSPNSLYVPAFATFGADAVYDQRHAEGFIRLLSLPARIAAKGAAPPSSVRSKPRRAPVPF